MITHIILIEFCFSSLACRCKVEAEKNGFKYFGIRYFGECYGGNAETVDNARSSSRCFQGAHYGPCNDEAEAECGGKELADYVYSLKKSGEEGIFSVVCTVV